MSGGREGNRFTYPDSLIRLLFHLPYRYLGGIKRGLSMYIEGLEAPNCTTLNRRINRLNLNIDEIVERERI
ncbi:MAG: hypothetical protein DRP11_02505 [Candidatus Aenigmatarchaeota archaeon]|nr:MAG: hypothetical protein DRP11_02505 [Candidatus Aenigmarchaeota archaeon]